MDCKDMATPMEPNLKLLSDSSSETIDAMMFRQMIGSLMYLMNTRPDICFAVNTLSQYLTDSRHVLLEQSPVATGKASILVDRQFGKDEEIR